MGVEGDEDEVDDVEGNDEVEDEFGALDYEEDRNNTVSVSLTPYTPTQLSGIEARVQRVRRYTHIKNAFAIHTIPSSHPCVVSPLSAVHPSISSSSLNGVPITSVVNRIITTAPT